MVLIYPPTSGQWNKQVFVQTKELKWNLNQSREALLTWQSSQNFAKEEVI